MNADEASQQLQTIRTLMERAALYRHAMGPTFVGLGLLGIVGGGLGFGFAVGAERGIWFVLYWSFVALVGVIWALLRIRSQAIVDDEPFWTPPTRRVVSAVVPPLVVGLGMTVFFTFLLMDLSRLLALVLIPLWMALHGLALHAAGSYTLRGIRWLGWGFILAALGAAACGFVLSVEHADRPTVPQAHLVMAMTFGLGHLIAGIRLILAERPDAS